MVKADPVMKLEACEANKTANPLISSICATLFIGIILSSTVFPWSLLANSELMGVRKYPGRMEFARISYLAHSTA